MAFSKEWNKTNPLPVIAWILNILSILIILSGGVLLFTSAFYLLFRDVIIYWVIAGGKVYIYFIGAIVAILGGLFPFIWGLLRNRKFYDWLAREKNIVKK